MKSMTYKGYNAEISYSNEDKCFVGHVVNIDSMVSFHGNTDDELRTAFQEMIDFYIQTSDKPENFVTIPFDIGEKGNNFGTRAGPGISKIKKSEP